MPYQFIDSPKRERERERARGKREGEEARQPFNLGENVFRERIVTGSLTQETLFAIWNFGLDESNRQSTITGRYEGARGECAMGVLNWKF